MNVARDEDDIVDTFSLDEVQKSAAFMGVTLKAVGGRR